MSIPLIQESAEIFRAMVKESTGIVLEYREASIGILDEIIEKSVIGQPPEYIERIAQYLGAFLGEVMVAELGMTWVERKEDRQWVVSAVAKNGNEVMSNPWNKIYKRIDLGAEENLGYYFAMVRKTIAGEIAP